MSYSQDRCQAVQACKRRKLQGHQVSSEQGLFSSNNENLNNNHSNNFVLWQREVITRSTPTMENMNSSQQHIKQESPTITKPTRSYSEGSASCTPHSSFSQQWVCDSCGTTEFDYERVQEGCHRCDHEERSLHFVKSM
jgi:hypothetical protein